MHDRGGVSRQRQSLVLIFHGNHFEHQREFRERLFPSGHESIAAGQRRHFRYPPVRLVPIEDYLVVVKTHATPIILHNFRGGALWNNLRMRRSPSLAFALATIWPLAAADLAPTGTLRATFLGSNPVQGRVDPKTGAVSGPVADLVAELAKQLGIPYTITPAPNAAGVIEKIKNHSADIGFLAYDAPRAAEVDFAGPFELMYNTYVVAAGSPIKTSAEVDRPGLVVGAVKGQTQEIFLSGNLKNAKLRAFSQMPPQNELERLLASGELAAFGLNRQRAEDAENAAGLKLRALADNFLAVEQEFVVEKGNPEKVDYLNRFVDRLRDSGFLKASIEKAALSGVGVAPRHAQ